MKNRRLASAILIAATAAALSGQRPHMGNARPTAIAPVTGSARTLTYFAASDGAKGVELFQTDGTGTGTKRVADIEVGPRGSYPTQITWLSGTSAFFTARTKNVGRELFYTDGTKTYLIEDIETGKKGSDPRELTVIGSKVYFTARTSTHGRELWCATSAKDSAKRLTDLNPKQKSSSPYDLTVLAGELWFAASDPAIGTELFRWKPTGSLTKIDIDKVATSTPTELTVFGSHVYFAATTRAQGREVWRANATTLQRMTDIRSGAGHSNPTQLTAGADRLAFTAQHPTRGRELYTLTATGTVRLTSNFANGHTIRNVTAGALAAGPVFWFTVQDPIVGVELFRTHRSSSSSTTVRMVHDVFAGTGDSSPSNLAAVGKRLFFRATTKNRGCELLTTDGAKLTPLTDIRTGSGARGNAKSSYPGPLSRFGSKFLFSAEGNDAGIELWSTDGTPTGTVQVVPGAGLDPSPVLPSQSVRIPLVAKSVNAVEIDIEDAPKSQSGWMVMSSAIPKNPIVIRGFLRGALMVDPSPPALLVPIVTDAKGNYHKRFPFPAPTLTAPVPLGWQAVIKTGGFTEVVVAAQNDACTAGSGKTSGGKSATASGCADDDTGEADITVTAGTWSGDDAWLAMALLTPYGERVPVDAECVDAGSNLWPIAPDQTIRIHGTFDLFTPTDVEDPTEGTNRLLLLIFDEPPSAEDLDKGVEVWRSYC